MSEHEHPLGNRVMNRSVQCMRFAFRVNSRQHGPAHPKAHHLSQNGGLRTLSNHREVDPTTTQSRGGERARSRVCGKPNPWPPRGWSPDLGGWWCIHVQRLDDERSNREPADVVGGHGYHDIQLAGVEKVEQLRARSNGQPHREIGVKRPKSNKGLTEVMHGSRVDHPRSNLTDLTIACLLRPATECAEGSEHLASVLSCHTRIIGWDPLATVLVEERNAQTAFELGDTLHEGRSTDSFGFGSITPAPLLDRCHQVAKLRSGWMHVHQFHDGHFN